MGCQNLRSGHRLHHLAISLLILVISTSSHFRLIFHCEGRKLMIQTPEISQTTVKVEDKALLRAHVGSRPPRCEQKCTSCSQCEAIQVPTNPQINNSTTDATHVDYVRLRGDDDNSNYKPISWKCKCGNLIFNP
ncbi:hypothetical protein BUALT_Bualt04G0095500 [Buddleja alternifolia]|uniref:Epidermal patterning factor-like protein n=1 Tax=Buddleja alternifolia TaxID=168488 RepID=A0AAV6XU25_9LAMI|nr:hypothetical protein BUALT_Bualt04G0095500 [Buddleja alternifolia]